MIRVCHANYTLVRLKVNLYNKAFDSSSIEINHMDTYFGIQGVAILLIWTRSEAMSTEVARLKGFVISYRLPAFCYHTKATIATSLCYLYTMPSPSQYTYSASAHT